jgi:hypothetical protein
MAVGSLGFKDDVYKRAEGIRRGNGKRCSIKHSGRAVGIHLNA